MKAAKPTVDIEEMRRRINALQIQADKSKQLADSNIRIVKKKNKGRVWHSHLSVVWDTMCDLMFQQETCMIDLTNCCKNWMKFWAIWQMQTEKSTCSKKIPTQTCPILTDSEVKIWIFNVSYSTSIGKALFTVLIRNSEDLDTCRNQRSQQIKYLQIENEKLRMDLNNETTHGKKLERTVEDLNNRLLDAQNQLRITESKMASR